jgi:hypothetical protein
VLRFEVSEVGQEALPAVDIGDDAVVIGSGAAARIRLPVHAARETHVRIAATRWTALADVRVIGVDATQPGVVRPAEATVLGPHAGGEPGVLHRAGATGDIAGGVTFQLGEYRVRVAPAPSGATAAPPQRTESLARELVRGLLGTGAAPVIEIERGPVPGIKRVLPPPEVTIVIGRGEEASWIVIDEDLSRVHAEIHRGWDGVTISDLESKNGTRVDGVRIKARTLLHDGALIELGNVALRFRDPAERHLRGEATAAATPRAVHGAKLAPPPPAAASSWSFLIAAAIAGLAIAGLVWVLAS